MLRNHLQKKSLLNILSKYYDGNVSKAVEMNDFILDNREVSVQESITRKINNDDS